MESGRDALAVEPDAATVSSPFRSAALCLLQAESLSIAEEVAASPGAGRASVGHIFFDDGSDRAQGTATSPRAFGVNPWAHSHLEGHLLPTGLDITALQQLLDTAASLPGFPPIGSSGHAFLTGPHTAAAAAAAAAAVAAGASVGGNPVAGSALDTLTCSQEGNSTRAGQRALAMVHALGLDPASKAAHAHMHAHADPDQGAGGVLDQGAGGMLDQASLAREQQSQLVRLCQPEELTSDLSGLTVIGQGCHSVAFQAHWRGARVAVKFTSCSSLDQSSYAIIRQALISKALSHPNVLQHYSVRCCLLTGERGPTAAPVFDLAPQSQSVASCPPVSLAAAPPTAPASPPIACGDALAVATASTGGDVATSTSTFSTANVSVSASAVPSSEAGVQTPVSRANAASAPVSAAAGAFTALAVADELGPCRQLGAPSRPALRHLSGPAAATLSGALTNGGDCSEDATLEPPLPAGHRWRDEAMAGSAAGREQQRQHARLPALGQATPKSRARTQPHHQHNHSQQQQQQPALEVILERDQLLAESSRSAGRLLRAPCSSRQQQQQQQYQQQQDQQVQLIYPINADQVMEAGEVQSWAAAGTSAYTGAGAVQSGPGGVPLRLSSTSGHAASPGPAADAIVAAVAEGDRPSTGVPPRLAELPPVNAAPTAVLAAASIVPPAVPPGRGPDLAAVRARALTAIPAAAHAALARATAATAAGTAAAGTGAPGSVSPVSLSFNSFEGFGNPYSHTKHALSLPYLAALVSAREGEYLTAIIMEHADKSTLQLAVQRGLFRENRVWSGRVALRALLRTGLEVAFALQHLHSRSIVHGALRPGNVLLSSSNLDRRGFTVKVTNFSLARVCCGHTEDSVDPCGLVAAAATAAAVDCAADGASSAGGDSSMGGTNQQQRQQQGGEAWALRGTPSEAAAAASRVSASTTSALPFWSPEQLCGVVGKPSDVYAFGVTLFALCTGTTPYSGMPIHEIVAGVVDGSLRPSWPQVNPNEPAMVSQVRQLCVQCWQTDARARPSFTSICATLQSIEHSVRQQLRPQASGSSSLTASGPNAVAAAAAAAAAGSTAGSEALAAALAQANASNGSARAGAAVVDGGGGGSCGAGGVPAGGCSRLVGGRGVDGRSGGEAER